MSAPDSAPVSAPPVDNDPRPNPEAPLSDTGEAVRSGRKNVAVRGHPTINHDEIRREVERRAQAQSAEPKQTEPEPEPNDEDQPTE